MHTSRVSQIVRSFTLFAGVTGALTTIAAAQSPEAQGAQHAIQKANTYIEVAKMTERAVESWERYASWVNMKTGPTGKERYISYGMYELTHSPELLQEARTAAGAEPKRPKLDAAMTRYINAYEALAPLVNEAAAYYDRNGYTADNAAKGRDLHNKMVPLSNAVMAERNVMMPELRALLREVEQQELAEIEARGGRSTEWHVATVMHTINRVVDLFPRDRPQPIGGDMLDEMMQGLGPESSGAEFDQIISGVIPPKNTTIDVERFGEALAAYSEAVDSFDRFAKEKPDAFGDFAPLPREMMEVLTAFHGPLRESQGREFGEGGQMVNRIVEIYFSMLNESNRVWSSQLRFLP